MKKEILGALLALVIAAPGIGQDEASPYFSLSSNRTFDPETEAAVELSASNVSSLEFRVYRVKDAVQFFEQLESSSSFGSQAVSRRAAERTMIEKIRTWKRGLRADIRRSLRAQFTDSPREKMDALLSGAPKPQTTQGTRETRYAEAPVLNPQQLVLSFRQPVASKNRFAQQAVKLGIHEKGVYLVEATRGDLQAYTIVIVSNLVLTSKFARGRIFNYLADRTTGEPVPGADLFLVGPGTERVALKTSADGIAETSLTDRKPGELRLVARRGADIAANALSEYQFDRAENRTGYIYTDRPVYRPGHTVHFKGIFRQRKPDGYALPIEVELPVKIEDATGNVVYQNKLGLTLNGTAQSEFTLPQNAPLGYYFIQFQAGDQSLTASFEVEEYKKPEYEVRVQPDVPRILQGKEIAATIDAKYYFGEPVHGAMVKYSVYRDRYWFPLWYDPDDDQASGADNDDGNGGDEVSQGEGRLDNDGILRVRIPTRVSDQAKDYRYRIDARVTDAARREISGVGGVIATYGSFLLNATPEQYFYSPGGRARVKIDARDYDSKPVATPVHLELIRFNWRNPKTHEVVSTAEGRTSADGSAQVDFPLPALGGEFQIRVTAPTREGRTVEDSAFLWVSGSSGATDAGPTRELEIVPDKKKYVPGETAHFLIATGKAGIPLLVTVEGRDLRDHHVLRSKDQTVTFNLPIAAHDEPGFFVTAQYIQDGAVHRGSKYIRVPADDHKLNVSVRADKPQYKPGETATYNLSVTDAKGQPVPRAELSLGVVDEAIYAIRRDSTPDMMQEFFGRDYNHVPTEDSLTYPFWGEAGRRRMQLAQLRSPSKLAQLKPERLQLPKVRKVFPDTAFWAAELLTNSEGKAQTRVDLPDSLTTWRATARGVTSDTKVGSAVAKNITRKNLILRFSAPRFFTRGDEVVISALVHNYLETAQNTQVSLEMTGLEVVNGGPKTISISPKSEVRLDWRVRASQVGMAKILGKALGTQESDALEVEIPVSAPGVKLSEAKGGSMPAGSSAPVDLTFPGKIEPGSRRILVRLSPSIAGALFGAVDYLTTFPYGCVEQTMSSFLPNIIVQQTVRDLNLKADLDQAQLRQKIDDGLDRLYAFQHKDGGWGWWETDESHPFMTAYVVAGLAQAQMAGTPVRVDLIDRGAQWITTGLSSGATLAPDLRAYMMYALAERNALNTGEPAQPLPLDGLYRDRSGLSPYGLALLGLTLEQAKDARAEEIATLLERTVQQDSEQAWWPATRDELLDFDTDATPEATAFVTRFLSHRRPQSPLLPKAAAWLMNHRNEGYWWSSTKQTAMVIYGLTDYLKVTKELDPNFTATVTLNGREVLSKRFDSAAGFMDAPLNLSESEVQPALNRLQVSSNGRGRLYYSARAEYYSSEERLQRNGTISLNILREYFRLSPTQAGDKIVYDTSPLTGPLSPGDTIAVRLTVTGSDWSYLLIEDPIPSGTEFIARDDKYELREKPPWWSFFFTRREMHDDRMALFVRNFAAGQQDYFYLLKVVNPGTFYASPARVQPMYQPSVLATTAGQQVQVQQ